MSYDHNGLEEIETDILHNMLKVLFGETALYVGDKVAAMPERRRANVVRICKIALRRLGDAVSDPGEVPPRVIGCLLEDGSYCRDLVASEYWGGFVACSRGPNPRDDRAARRLKILSRLGEYQIRSHYLFYSSLRLLIMNFREPAKTDFEGDLMHLATFIPAGYYILAMDYNKDEISRMPRLISDVLYGLGQELLLGGSNTGTDEYLKTQFKTNVTNIIRGEGIVFTPSLAGIQFYLWAFGVRDADPRYILDPRLDSVIPGVQMGVEESGLVYKA